MESILTILRGVSKSYGPHRVLSGVSLTVRPGERLAVVGDNGCGKSTLLRLLAGAERPDDGEAVPPAGRGYLSQTPALPPGHTVQAAVDAALAGLRAMERRMRELESALTPETLEEYGDLLTEFEARGGYEADARVDRSLHGLGLSRLGRDRPLGSLSGGELARLGLACLLAASPETLLLDEPTNHLDESALRWLEDRLRGHRGSVVVVSHDRVFLDRVATSVVEVEAGGLTRYGGGYSGFLAEKAAARARQEQAHAAWRDEVRQTREHAATTARRVAAGRGIRDNNKMAYDRNAGRVQSSVASRVRNARERLRRLEADPVPPPPALLRFHGAFTATPAQGILTHLPAFHPSRETTAPTTGEPAAAHDRTSRESTAPGGGLVVRAGDRVLVTGPNGAGKSTLLRAVAERAGCRVGYLPQEVSYEASQYVLDAYPHGPRHERRAALLSTGLFRPETLDQRVGELSAGQRRRLALAALIAAEHDLLVLDEPTNHLSPALVEELEQALDRFPGALVIATHDRALRGRFRGTVLNLTGEPTC